MSIKSRLPAAAILLAALPSEALAQQAPGNAIEDRSRQQLRPPTESERGEAILTGDTDIVLTQRTRLFTLSGSAGLSYTSNAFLAPASPVEDGFGQVQASLGVGTRIGGKVNVFASLGVAGLRYFDNKALNYNAFTGLVGAQASFGRLSVTASYQPTIVLSGDFGSRQLTSHSLKLAAAVPVRVGPVVVEPHLAVERTLTDPSDYAAWSGNAGLTASMVLSRHHPIIAFASIDYERRNFDSYFPGLVGVDRRDDRLTAGAGLVWKPFRAGELRLSYNFQRNWSTSDVNRYAAHTGGLALSAALRF